MKIYRLFLILITILWGRESGATIDVPVTIFVHGTRRASKLFIKYTHQVNKIVSIKEIPTSYITHTISQALADSDSPHFPSEYFYVFGWSGKLNHQERVHAASILYNEIIELIEALKKENINPIINLITHSHGGNVALNLARCAQAHDLKFQINNLILLACPVQEQTRTFIHHPLFKNIYTLYSTFDITQRLDPQGLHRENKNKKVPFFSQREFGFCPKLRQAEVKINGGGISHLGFLLSKFLKCLPPLLNKMEQLPLGSTNVIKVKI